MKHFLLLIFTLCTFVAVCAEEEIPVSYCRGVVQKSEGFKVIGNGWASAAIFIPQTVLKTYEGNIVKAVRVGLVSTTGVSKLVVWVRKSLQEAPLASDTVDVNTLKSGWNRIVLSHPQNISSQGDGLYVGYSIEQRSRSSVISVTDNYAEGSFYLCSPGGEWQDMYLSGAVSIEAIIGGDKMPKSDLGITASSARMNESGKLELRADIHNGALNDIEGFDMEATWNGNIIAKQSFDNFISSTDNTSVSFVVDQPYDFDYHSPINLTISSLHDGLTDDAKQNNSMTATWCYPKHVLVEEFTTEDCVNCPRVSEYMYDVMDRQVYKGKAFAVAHHSGYGTDWLTQSCDKDLTWFYNAGGNMYTPALMFDRYPYYLNDKGNRSACTNPGSADEIALYINDRLQEDAHAELSVAASYTDEAQTQLNVTVTGERSRQLSILPMRVTVYVVEDSIASRDQHGIDTQSGYYHQHVIRAYNSSWGDEVVWTGNTFVYDTMLKIDPSWKKGHMHVIAFLSRYNSSDPTQCDVENVAGLDFSNITTGIKALSENSGYSPDYYDTLGRKVHSMQHGIYIVRNTDGSCRKIFIK